MCTGGLISSNVVSCLFDLITRTKDVELGLGILTGGYKPYSLSLGVKKALDAGCDYIMFIDCDQIFPPDGINRLLLHDKDIVGANYNERRFPLQATVKLADESGKLIAGNISDKRELFEVYAMGLGFVLIKTTVFSQIEKPWFNAPVDEKGDLVTDDFYFFDKCQKKGIKVWCDPALVIGHQGSYIY